MMHDQKKHTCEMTIPFPTARGAQIAYNSLRVDISREPRKNLMSKELVLSGNDLRVNFSATEARYLRVAVSSFFDGLSLVVKTIEEFGRPIERASATSDG